MKVFHGISGAAGQPASIVAALRREGIDAVNYVTGENIYEFAYDRRIPAENDLHAQVFSLLQSDLTEFDVFHFYFRPLFFDSTNAAYPMGLDLILLRLLGKRLVLNFRGSEVRIHSQFKAHSPFNYVDENPDDLISKFPEDIQRQYIELASAVCNHVLVPDPELQTYVPNAVVVPRSIDLDLWQPVPETGRVTPLIVHAPSRRTVKGTEHIIQAISELRAEGFAFDFQLVEGMTNLEARETYRRADIVVDQLRIGWYGVLAVEGMALGKAVVSFVREDLAHHLGDSPPLAIADPRSIKSVLQKLITDPAHRIRLGQQGLQYCRENHDSRVIARRLIDIYRSEGSAVDEQALIEFFSSQFSRHSADRKETLSNLAAQAREIRILSRKLDVANQHLDNIKRKLGPLLWLRNRYRKLSKSHLEL